MIIRTYDDKDEATYDLRGLEEYMRSHIEFEEQKKREAVVKAEAYNNGYREAMSVIASIMGASNYRVKEPDNEQS